MCIFEGGLHIGGAGPLRTNIDIDEALLAEARAALGTRTKKATVEAALRRVVQLHRQRGLLDLWGKIDWQGDLDQLRSWRPSVEGGEVEVETPASSAAGRAA